MAPYGRSNTASMVRSTAWRVRFLYNRSANPVTARCTGRFSSASSSASRPVGAAPRSSSRPYDASSRASAGCSRAEVQDRKRRRHCRFRGVRVVDRRDECALRTIDGANPERGDEVLRGSEPVIDRADRDTACLGDRRDGCGACAIVDQQPASGVQHRVRGVQERARHGPILEQSFQIGLADYRPGATFQREISAGTVVTHAMESKWESDESPTPHNPDAPI